MPETSSARQIPLARPTFDEAEARAVAEVIASGWVSQGPKVAEFERIFAARVGVKHAVATTSCTTALHLALLLAGAGPGDEVICPSYTFVATANVVLYCGARPVFADIDPVTGNLDPSHVRSLVTERTKAVLPVHQVGLAADMDPINELRARGLWVVEDAACATGAEYRGRAVGALGNLACFSFHPRKSISTGEGGMLTTDSDDLAERARRLRSFGASVSDHVRHQAGGVLIETYEELGYNYRLTDLQAAIGIQQMKKLDGLLAERRRIAERYNRAFGDLPGVLVPRDAPYGRHTYQSYGIQLLPESGVAREDLLAGLVARGVSCRRGIAPIHREPLYRKRFGEVSLPHTDEVSARTVFLPIFGGLSEDDQGFVIDAVLDLLGRSR